MNLFYLHPDPTVAAQMQCDKHVVKMLLETAQMLCTAHHEVDGSRAPKRLYKSAYKNHPSTRWVRADAYHYEWAYKHFAALCDEYTYRYGKVTPPIASSASCCPSRPASWRLSRGSPTRRNVCLTTTSRPTL